MCIAAVAGVIVAKKLEIKEQDPMIIKDAKKLR